MAGMEVAVKPPHRWDAPLDDAMREVDVDHLLQIQPFTQVDPTAFPAALSLRGILRNDARLVHCQPGDLVVREGDYGHSAFLLLTGTLRVAVAGLSAGALGQPPAAQSGWWKSIGRWWQRPRYPEVRAQGSAAAAAVQEALADKIPQGIRADRSRMFLMDIPRVLSESETVELLPGEIFGELAALTRSPRSATVFAPAEATLLEIRWQGLRDLMRYTPALREHVEQLYRQNSLRVHLRETPLLAQLPADSLSAVADATVFESHGSFDWNESFDPSVRRRRGDAINDEPLIVEEGGAVDGVLLIRSGFARQSQRHGRGHRTLAYLGRGQAFGWAEALEGAKTSQPIHWQNSLRALGYVDVLRIPLGALAQHVLGRVDSREVDEVISASQRLLRRSHGPDAPQNSASHTAESVEQQGLIEFLVDKRLTNGQQAMVIDLDRCTRCDDCLRACAATHDNNPRFIRQGQRHGPLQFAQACMHCVDPVCMIGCPTGAIGRDVPTGVVRINDPTCIGCGTCAMSCPYDNIRMVEIRDTRGAIMIDEHTRQPIHKATKCDLCVELPGGPACQHACPHDALVRIDLSLPDALAQWTAR
jgi:Fe-S-cluster-containing dehydrogenase component